MQALSPVFLRVGGTLADFITYDVGDPQSCPPLTNTGSGKWDFRGGCLNMTRWSQIGDFCRAAGCGVVFGLSDLYGRPTNEEPWDPSNARALLQHTAAMDPPFPLAGLELGNELNGPQGILGHLTPEQIAGDFSTLRAMVNELWPSVEHGAAAAAAGSGGGGVRPLVIGPDAMMDADWLAAFLPLVANGTLDAFTYHMYLAAGVDPTLVDKLTDPTYLYQHSYENAARMASVAAQAAPGLPVWMGEGGGAYNSGQRTTTDAFAGGFWYLDQLGAMASLGHGVHCRQSFTGGNYGLLSAQLPHVPRPDYWNALLFRSLMGPKVLKTAVTGYPSADLRAYAHCANARAGAPSGSVTVLAINYNRTAAATVQLAGLPAAPRVQYLLTSSGLHNQSLWLNGQQLLAGGAEGTVPDVVGMGERVAAGPIELPPLSYGFFVLPAAVAACA